MATMADRPRIIIALPNVTESGTVTAWLHAEGYEAIERSAPKAAIDFMETNSFDLLIADAEFVFRDTLHTVGRRRNPLRPTIVIGDDTAAQPCYGMGAQAMFVARPIERVLLACAIAEVVQDGRPTRRSTRRLIRPFTVVANGIPGQIIDVSPEGLRLALPPDRRYTPPQAFKVKIPSMGGTLVVQRMWTTSHPAGSRAEAIWCGAALVQNGPLAIQAWRSLIGKLPGIGDPVPIVRPTPKIEVVDIRNFS